MTVDEFVKAEKARLTVWARYRRTTKPKASHDEDYWRAIFIAHCSIRDEYHE